MLDLIFFFVYGIVLSVVIVEDVKLGYNVLIGVNVVIELGV